MSRPAWNVLVAILVIILVCALPILSVWLSTAIASGLGCALDEGGAHPCAPHGIELGDALYQMYTVGWLGIATIPLGLVAIAVLLLGWIVAALYRRVRGADTTRGKV